MGREHVRCPLSVQNIPNWPEMIIEKNIFSFLWVLSTNLCVWHVCVCKGGVWSVCTCLLLIMECIHFTYRIIFIMPQLQYSTLAEQQQLYPVVTWDTLGLLSMFWYSGLAHCSSRFRYCLLVLAYFWLSGLAYKVDKARFGLKSTKSLCEVGHGVFACKLVFQTEHSIILIFL